MIPFEDATTLSLLFHLNSQPWLNIEAYESSAYKVEYKELPEAQLRTALPVPQQSPLLEIMKKRSSCRSYKLQSMPLETLATLLRGAYGISTIGTVPDGVTAQFRNVPSAGGLFPLEIYVATQRVTGIPDGIHHYALRPHFLELVREGSLITARQSALLVDPFVRDANLVIFIAAIFARTQKKYGPRGYRYILLEAGHVAQNLCLLATEQGLGTLCIGGFVDSEINHLLGLDGLREAVVYGVGIGYPEKDLKRQRQS